MPQDILDAPRQMTLEQFQAFYTDRPEHEKWELINGVVIMMTPPTLIHQRMSGNLETMLNHRLAQVRPGWWADCEIGILAPEDRITNPEPDVTFIDTDIEIGQIYAERFYIVAEVLLPSNSPEKRDGSDKPVPLLGKLNFYRGHSHCRAVIIIEQQRIEATIHWHDGDQWHEQTLTSPSDRLVLPDIGDIGALADVYRHTPLAPLQ